MAQEQDTLFPLMFNSSNYEEEDYAFPDVPDSTPFGPVKPRTRHKQMKNPFYPLTAASYGAYAVLMVAAVIFSVGIMGNVSLMCIVCHNYYMRSISNSLLANLALWDFIVIFFCLPLVVFHELTKNWLLGEFSCRIVPYLEVASLGVNTFTLCALCIDRFRAATNVKMYYEMIENWAVPPPAPFPFPVPYHAFCRALWLFATPCAEISTKITQQIQAFSPEYTLAVATPLKIKANHTSPDGIGAQNITFSFSPTVLTAGCRVSAQSISLGFSSLLDNGLNYCNLYKLLSASGLTSAPGFMEMTNEWACLGYGMAKCIA